MREPFEKHIDIAIVAMQGDNIDFISSDIHRKWGAVASCANRITI